MRRVLGRLRNRTAAFAHDLLMIPLAWFGAYWLRFNLEQIPDVILAQSFNMLPAVVLVQGAVFWYLGLYRGVWRFASMPDLIRILNAVVTGVALSAVAIFLLTRMQDVPRSVIPLYGLLLVGALGGPRLLYRWLKEHGQRVEFGKRVLVAGAGAAGEMLVRDMLREVALGLVPVAFVDDDSKKRGREIHGVRVAAKCGGIPRLAREQRIDLVILAIPTATSREMRRLVGLCEKAGVAFRTLPRVDEIPSGRSHVGQLRAVSIEDLLGREVVTLNRDLIETGVRGQMVAVTGAGGSIGSELCRQIAGLRPAGLVLVDRSEFHLYSIDLELRREFPALAVHPVLADICDEAAMACCFRRHCPQVVFHAAAYKHVPMLEDQVREAVLNNVIGTRTVALAAAQGRVATVVLISTDKAVNPTNVMGATKRVAELVCQNLDAEHPNTRFITVRFGNVLDSAGSVVPLFRRQIETGGPVTVTHGDMVRYFMTIPEACQLILQAGSIGRGGEIFVLDMGEPVRIQYLAEQMILLAGKTPGDDIEITHTGLRPGEKLFEELFHDEEQLSATESEKIFLARSRQVAWPVLSERVEVLYGACVAFDEDRIKRQLAELVPEYVPDPGSDNAAPGASNVIPIASAHPHSGEQGGRS